MITGILLSIAGLLIGFYGATRFNFGIMAGGWCITGAGAVVFLSHTVVMW